jgi:hypothetical protein
MQITFRPLANGWYRCVQTLEKVRSPKIYAFRVARMLQGHLLAVRRAMAEEKVSQMPVLPTEQGRQNRIANISSLAAAGKFEVLHLEYGDMYRIISEGI